MADLVGQVKWNQNLRAKKRRHIEALKKAGVCADCGEGDFRCLTFFHTRGEKPYKGGVLTLASQSASWLRLGKALNDCDLVCLNCKAKRQKP